MVASKQSQAHIPANIAKTTNSTTKFSEYTTKNQNIEMGHQEVQQKLHQKLNTFVATRGLYKAVVRNIPTILSKEDFYIGLNVSLPIN